jgi:hypothetical protein
MLINGIILDFIAFSLYLDDRQVYLFVFLLNRLQVSDTQTVVTKDNGFYNIVSSAETINFPLTKSISYNYKDFKRILD